MGRPCFQGGLTEGQTIVAVNGNVYSTDDFKDVIKGAKGGTTPIELLIKDKDEFRTTRIDYHDGLRCPHFERVGTGQARLDGILTQKK